MTDRVGTLLAAASVATDRGLKLAYLGEARAVLAAQEEHVRSLRMVLDAQEQEVARLIAVEGGRPA